MMAWKEEGRERERGRHGGRLGRGKESWRKK
jgi:hypothetical protein